MRREMLRPEAQRLVGLLKDEVPVKTGATKDSIHYKIFIQGDVLVFKVYSREVTKYLMEGTSPHIIPKGPGPVAFIWENAPFPPNAPDKIHHIFAYVNHPGTKKNRYVGRAYRRWLPGVRQTLRRIAGYYGRKF